jgi:putative ABC transport system substrate-binding protein
MDRRDPFLVVHADRDSLPIEGREQSRSSAQARRRTLVYLLAGLSAGVKAQSTQKVPRIGVVAPLSPPPAASPDIDGFRLGLSELGYVEGGNILLEYRWALGRQDASSRYAEELARLDLDVIVVAGPISALSAKRLTRKPIIFAAAGVDPVSIGLVESLARPGGNATGLAMLNEEITGKRFELIKETVPGVARVGVLVAPGDPRYTDLMVRAVEQAARTAAIHVQLLRLRKCAI